MNSCIVAGFEGTYINEYALELAKEMAGNGRLVEVTGTGKSGILLKDIEVIGELPNEESVKSVVIIYDAHTMAPVAQDRLLKILEDSVNVSVVLSCSDVSQLLDTVKSRLPIKRVLNRISDSEKYNKLVASSGYTYEQTVLASADRPEWLSHMVEMGKLGCIVKALEFFKKGDILSLFKELHLVKEKDSECITNDTVCLKSFLLALHSLLSTDLSVRERYRDVRAGVADKIAKAYKEGGVSPTSLLMLLAVFI